MKGKLTNEERRHLKGAGERSKSRNMSFNRLRNSLWHVLLARASEASPSAPFPPKCFSTPRDMVIPLES